MIYILVALQDELDAAQVTTDNIQVIYTGVGKINASIEAMKVALRDDCELIINFGTAGVLNKALIGQLSRINLVRQRDMDARPLAPIGVTPFEAGALAGDISVYEGAGVSLSTGDDFVRTLPEISSDMVDMEAYAIAKIAKRFDKELIILKYGSDFADEDAGDSWTENCAKGASLFTEWLARYLQASGR